MGLTIATTCWKRSDSKNCVQQYHTLLLLYVHKSLVIFLYSFKFIHACLIPLPPFLPPFPPSGRFGTVYKCLHSTTQQMYAAKLLPLSVGKNHAQHELSMLGQISHSNLTQMVSAHLTPTHYVILFQL